MRAENEIKQIEAEITPPKERAVWNKSFSDWIKEQERMLNKLNYSNTLYPFTFINPNKDV